MRIKQTKNPEWSQEKYGESSILGLQFKGSVTMSLVPGVLHRVSRRRKQGPCSMPQRVILTSFLQEQN